MDHPPQRRAASNRVIDLELDQPATEKTFDPMRTQTERDLRIVHRSRMFPEQSETKENNHEEKSWKEEFSTCFGLCHAKDVEAYHPRNFSIDKCKGFLGDVMPVMNWFKFYLGEEWKSYFWSDFIASISAGSVLITQGLALAILAGLPPAYGLYSAFTPLFIFPLFTTSRHLAVGATSTSSLLIAVTLAGLAPTQSDEYIQLVSFLVFMVGVVLLCFNLFGIGHIIELLMTYPVITGRLQATALLTALAQIKGILGIPLATPVEIQSFLTDFAAKVSQTNPYAVLYGLTATLVLVITKKVKRINDLRLPWFVIVIFTATLVAYLTNDSGNIHIVGTIPKGLPRFAMFSMGNSKFGFEDCLFAAISIAVVNFCEGIALGKKYAADNHYTLNVNQELIAVGFSNFISSFFQSSVVSTGVSRSNVNYQAGAKTPMSGVFSIVLVLFTLLFLTGIFYHTPLAALSAVVIAGAVSLLDINDFKYLWKYQRTDFWMAFLNFWLTLLFGVQESVYIALGISLLQIMFKSSKTRVVRLGYVRKDEFMDFTPEIPSNVKSDSLKNILKEQYKNVTMNFHDYRLYPEAILPIGILLIRFDEKLTSYNVSNLIDFIYLYVNDQIIKHKNVDQTEGVVSNETHEKTHLSKVDKDTLGKNTFFHSVIIDCRRILSIDSTALFQFEEFISNITQNGIKLYLAQVRAGFLNSLNHTKIPRKDRPVFTSMSTALAAALGLKSSREVIYHMLYYYNYSEQLKHIETMQSLERGFSNPALRPEDGSDLSNDVALEQDFDLENVEQIDNAVDAVNIEDISHNAEKENSIMSRT